jgi:glycosyltransferase involved in cell wall biosynthesis
MKVLQLYNRYRSEFGGEDAVVEATAALIEKRGGEALLFERSSRGLDESLGGKLRAFASGLYNPTSRRELASLLQTDRPDVVHAHNLYPLLSPSVLVACREARIPVVLSLHNYVLTCPTTNHLSHGQACDRCSGGREVQCVLRNCRGNLLESTAYALRSASARKLGFFHDLVDRYLALSEFARDKLVAAGFDADRIEVLPNSVAIPHESAAADPTVGRYVAFAGRMSHEKGVEVLLEAAAALPDTPFHLAGDGPLLDRLSAAAPSNVKFLGRLSKEETAAHYRGARMLVLPSTCFEMCPLVISEAMSHGLPVLASRIGGLPELIDENETGHLFEPGDAKALAERVANLWQDPAECARLGRAGRAKAIREYGESPYGDRLMSLYAEVARRGAGVAPSR